jgi:protein-glutamine gamma-glutamyltransferase
MIKILGGLIDSKSIMNQYPTDSIQAKILNILTSSKRTYDYSSAKQINFELNMRNSIVSTSKAFYESDVKFEVFKESICNAEYWERTEKGGFLLKENIKPSDAINDIFKNSSKYGTECSTAIIIIYYKALLDIYSEELFNTIFKSIHLLNWHYINPNLEVRTYKIEEDYLPGDCRYFKNPDFSPEDEEWRGENAIDMGNGKYFGHGIGIETSDGIIKNLNENRKDNPTESAFLTDYVTKPNFKHLANIYNYLSSRALSPSYYRQYNSCCPFCYLKQMYNKSHLGRIYP